MEKAVNKYSVRITIVTLFGLLASIAYNFFSAGAITANLKRDVEYNTKNIQTNSDTIVKHKEEIESTLNRIHDGLLAKGIIEPRK